MCGERQYALEKRLVRTLGRDHAVGNGGVRYFGAIILKVRVWPGVDVRDPRHGCWLSAL